MAGNVLSSDKETIPARYAIEAQAQVFMENDELLLPIPKAFAQCSRSLHTSKKFLCFQSVCSSRTACRFYQYGCGSSPHRARHASTLAGIILWRVNCRQKSSSCVYGTCRRYMKIQSSRILNHGASWQCVANCTLRPVCPYRMLRLQPIG
jgi:hypothetical protein